MSDPDAVAASRPSEGPAVPATAKGARTAADAAASARRDRSLFFRAAAFVLLAVATDLWLVKHHGKGISDLLQLGGLVGVVTVAVGMLDRFLGEDDRQTVRRPWVRVFEVMRVMITVPGLIVLFVVALVMGMSQSSIRVVLPDGTPPMSVTLTPVEAGAMRPIEHRTGGATSSLRSVRTSPFGMAYRVEVPGYLPKLVRVPPLTGAIVDAETDLRRVPIILLRIPIEALSTAADGTRLSVLKHGQEVAWGNAKGGAYVLGRTPRLDQRAPTWRMEASARAGAAASIDGILLMWHDVSRLTSDYLPALGDTLDVRLSGRHGHLLAKTRVDVGPEDLIDVEMAYTEPSP